jgi:hypothetical protein
MCVPFYLFDKKMGAGKIDHVVDVFCLSPQPTLLLHQKMLSESSRVEVMPHLLLVMLLLFVCVF